MELFPSHLNQKKKMRELSKAEKAVDNKAEIERRPENPLGVSSLWDRLVFRWPWPLLKLGLERPLTDDDLANVLEKDSSDYNRKYFERIWKEEKMKRPDRPSLHRAILKDFFTSIWYVQPMMAFAYTAKVSQAILLGLLVDSFEDDNDDRGYIWAGLIVACALVVLLEHHHVFFITWRKGMQLRISCVAAIYEKSLRLSSTHQDISSSYGKIMNLASNDVERFLLASLFISHLIWAPIQSVAILIVGCYLLGPAFAAGYAILVLVFVPLQFYLSGRFAFYRSKVAEITDQRVNFVSQAIRGARVMKMSGYEYRFLDRIQELRKSEVHQIKKANSLKAYNEALFFASNVVVGVTIFVVHVYTGGQLSPGDVFSVFTLINILQVEMAKHVSLGVMGGSECSVSISRIQRFLEYPEMPIDGTTGTLEPLPDQISTTNVLSMVNVKAYWNEVTSRKIDRSFVTDDDTSLGGMLTAVENVTVAFPRGQLTAIIGSVGSGKSALLQVVVGELRISEGSIERSYRELSYASQDPWVMDGTIRENIILGLLFQPEWYNQVVEACGLDQDFEQLVRGDQTFVGDRGVQLSGGQQARINLARAIYRDADVLVADDPLSAVDAKVGRQIYQQALVGLVVSRGKTVVLATHQHQYIRDDFCVLMAQGRIAHVGAYEDCVLASGGKLLAHSADGYIQDESPSETRTLFPVIASGNTTSEKNKSDSLNENQETSQRGIVTLETYLEYVRAMGGLWVGFFLLVLFSVTQTSSLITIASVGRWAERDPENQKEWDIVGFVIGLCGSVVFLAFLRAVISLSVTVRASRRLHDSMALSVMRAQIAFFDTNPLGRILNRFSADVGSNDDLLPHTLFDFFMILFIVLGAFVTTVTTLPFTLVVVPPLTWYFLKVRRIFVNSSRELKRLEGLARSPIFAMLSESLGGIATIRANRTVDYFRSKFRKTHDAHTRAFFGFIGASRWVGFRMDSLMFFFLSLVCFLSVLFDRKKWFSVDPAILGLSISMLLQLAGIFQWCIRQSAEVVNQMVSVERVLDFGKLEPEAPLTLDEDKSVVPKGWPKTGAVSVRNLSVRYRPSLPPALTDVSFEIPPQSRVGIVGRTGSGKSTVVQTLFRLLEAESGSIWIDGIDISSIGLHTLRTRLSVIPQSPTLFSGCSVRENLDLFNLHSDDAIWKVIEDCHLKELIDELPNGWDSPVSEGGSNFSVGQRQLLCLARAILAKSKILVLDEATASVDRRTDQLLQEALHHSFRDGTIIAVAHRLDTIIDYDYVLVLGRGRVLEYGSPAELLRQNGSFASMVSDTGEAMSSELRKRALQAELDRK